MREIYNDVSITRERFSNSEKAIQDFRKKLHFESTTIRDIANHSKVLEVNVTLPALVSLFETNKTSNWAKFSPPPNYYSQRKKSLYLVPSLGGPDKQDIDIKKIKSFLDILYKEKPILPNVRVLKYQDKKDLSNEDNNNHSQSNDEDDNNHSQSNKKEFLKNLQHTSKQQIKLINQGLVLIKVLEEGVKSTNVMIDYIISRIFQFVQG